MIASLVWRYYRGGDRERRQLQWLLLAVVVDLVINTQRVITAEGPILLLLSFVTIPVAIGIAVVRYQLLDIQLVVSRTLLYGLVIALVIAAYAGIVAALSLVVSAQAERGVSIVAAIVVAIAFNPLRLLIMKLVDRAFYGTRSDPAATASGVGQHLRDEDDLGEALERTRDGSAAAVAEPAPGGRHAGRRRRGGRLRTGRRPAADVPGPGGRHACRSACVGARACLHADDRRTLELIGTPLAAALHAAALREQVQLARTETVEAAAAERVRLQRELHDGLGPVLTSLSFTADAASNLVRSDPAEAERMLADVRDRAARRARRAYAGWSTGSGRSSWTTSGWPARCGRRWPRWPTTMRSGPEIRLQLPDELPPLSAAVELAAYRIVLEALANLVRHSAAGHCDVRITAGEQLVITIDDDGPPPAEWSRGSGCARSSTARRSWGVLPLAGPVELGWQVRAELPLASEATI